MGEIGEMLCGLALCEPQAIEPFFPRVRDREDVGVLRCSTSGVIFLSKFVQTPYEQFGVEYFTDWGVAPINDDDRRRAERFRADIRGKVWADVGCGMGGVIELLRADAEVIYAVEPMEKLRKALIDKGIRTRAAAEALPQDIEVITLFHVLEHLRDPIKALRVLKSKMRPGGKIIVEVPHARDFLIAQSNAFRAFTFWSEHLILHTRASLARLIELAGFSSIRVYGVQRFPLANHLYWLVHGKPGGHEVWKHLRNETLDASYADMLARNDATDTIIAEAVK